MAHLRKQFIFDLKTDKNSPVFRYYNSLPRAYDDIRKYMESNGFVHRQGSSYVSQNPMNDKQVRHFLLGLCKELPWLAECLNAFDVANIGRQHNLLQDIEETCELFSDEKNKWFERINSSNENIRQNEQPLSFDQLCKLAKSAPANKTSLSTKETLQHSKNTYIDKFYR